MGFKVTETGLFASWHRFFGLEHIGEPGLDGLRRQYSCAKVFEDSNLLVPLMMASGHGLDVTR